MIQVHPIGIILALVFAVSIGSLFRWMFKVPPMLPLPVIQVQHSVSALRKIIVPIGETIPSERAVELACRLGHDQKADLVLVHVITVPYSMSLDAPLPEQEKSAQKVLEIGCQIAARFGIHAQTRLLRQRHVADGVLQVAREEEADAIVLGVGIKSRVPGTDWGRTTADLLQRAPCEVIVDKVPMSAETMALQA
jgi:nucleotide-binding universal stress UspA family protein